jgi:SAM-dependent methyltransferase
MTWLGGAVFAARVVMVSLVAVAGAADQFPGPGRPVAPVVSPTWGVEAERDRAGEVDEIIARLGLRPGARVADIGAGEGYDALRLARRLGPRSQIFAEDLDVGALRKLARVAGDQGLKNIKTIEGAADDARLAPGSVDAVIMVHMYHEIESPFALLTRLVPAFKAGGRLGVEELDRPTNAHGTPPDLLRCELAAVGYREQNLRPMPGNLGYFAVFAPPSEARVIAPANIRPCVSKPRAAL